MKSHFITDLDGNRLRGNYFPFDFDKTKPPSASGFMINSERLDVPRVSTAPVPARKTTPSTFMIVDYNQDRQQLHSMVEKHGSPEPLIPPNTRSTIRRRLSIKPIDTLPKKSHHVLPAHSLRSSFILKAKIVAEEDQEASVSQQLFNKCDQATQTNDALYRKNFKGLSDYNDWSNSVAEPFFKVKYIIV